MYVTRLTNKPICIYVHRDSHITTGKYCYILYLQVMTHAAYIYDIQHVVIDNLQFMIGSSVKLVNYQTSCINPHHKVERDI